MNMGSDQTSGTSTTKSIFHFLCLILPFLAVPVVLPSGAGPALFGLLILWAGSQSGLRQAQALSMQFLLMNLNSEVFNPPSTAGLHHILPCMVIARLVYDQRFKVTPFTRAYIFGIAVSGVLLLLHSTLFSILPAVSALKTIGFTIYALACILLLTSCSTDELNKIARWYKTFVSTIIILSAPLLLSDLGRSRNGTGFNGILSHPNLIGVFLGVSLAAILAQALAASKISKIDVLVLLAGLVELLYSEARGGMLSLLLALSIWYGSVLTNVSKQSARVFGRGIILAALATPAIFAASATVQEAAMRFLSKSGRSSESGLIANFQRSRGGAIAYHAKLIRRSPSFGRGFQIVNSRSQGLPEVEYDPIWNKIPISASVENGFLYTSVVAELGLVGSIPIMFLFMILIRPLISSRENPANTLLLAVLFTNITEAAFFSPSGVGAWEWQMVGLFVAAHARENTPGQSLSDL